MRDWASRRAGGASRTTPQEGQECCSERSVERERVGGVSGGCAAVIVIVALMALVNGSMCIVRPRRSSRLCGEDEAGISFALLGEDPWENRLLRCAIDLDVRGGGGYRSSFFLGCARGVAKSPREEGKSYFSAAGGAREFERCDVEVPKVRQEGG